MYVFFKSDVPYKHVQASDEHFCILFDNNVYSTHVLIYQCALWLKLQKNLVVGWAPITTNTTLHHSIQAL